MSALTSSPEAAAIAALERLNLIEWRPNPAAVQSQMALLMEYMRRSVAWSKALGTIDLWPVYNIAGRAYPGLQEPRTVLQGFMRGPAARTGNPLITLTCQHYLRWAAASADPEMPRYQLDDPFEPLIMAYERGGRLEYRDGLVSFGWITITRESWTEFNRETPYVDELDHGLLNWIDSDDGY